MSRSAPSPLLHTDAIHAEARPRYRFVVGNRFEPGFSFFRSLSHGVRRSTWSCQQRWPASSPQRPGQSGWLIARGNVVGALTDACAMEVQCPFKYSVYMGSGGTTALPRMAHLCAASVCHSWCVVLLESQVLRLVVCGEVRVDGLLLVVPHISPLLIGSLPDPQQQPIRR